MTYHPSVSTSSFASVEQVREIARCYGERADAVSRSEWIGVIYPIICQIIDKEYRKRMDTDGLLTAALNQSIEVKFAWLVSGSNFPISYLRTSIKNLVRKQNQRMAALQYAEMINNQFSHERGDYFDSETKEVLRQWSLENNLLDRINSLPTRDRILLITSLYGVEKLSYEDLVWIAERRGVSLAVVEREVAKEVIRCAALRQETERKLLKIEKTLNQRRIRALQCRSRFLGTSAKNETKEKTCCVAALQRSWRRHDELIAKVQDPFHGSLPWRQLVDFLGEIKEGSNPDTVVNSISRRAKRLYDTIVLSLKEEKSTLFP